MFARAGPSSAEPSRGTRLLGGALTLVVAAATGSAAKELVPPNTEDGDLPPVEMVLQRLARVAALYRDQALRFTCDETITHTAPGHLAVHHFRYIYRYSGEDKALSDYREPRGRAAEASARQKERARLENYGLPAYLLRAYSWIFAFEEGVQPFFRYEVLAADKVLNRPAIRVRFEAIPPYAENRNDWCGTAWVDRESWQLLQVEAVSADECGVQAQLEARLSSEDDASPLALYPITHITTEFDMEKNGMRFPGRVVLERKATTVDGESGKPVVREIPVFRVMQTYKRYKFFGVRTHEDVVRYVERSDG